MRALAFAVLVACGSQPAPVLSGQANASEEHPRSRAPVELVARFADTSGLAIGTRVRVAGIEVGRITQLEPAGQGTLVWLGLREGPELWSNAVLAKKASGTLGESYLELDPGTEDGVATPLGPRCATYRSTASDEFMRCREVRTVVERVTSDALMKQLGL